MKNYLLPALISLTLHTSWALAQQPLSADQTGSTSSAPVSSTEVASPTATTTSESGVAGAGPLPPAPTDYTDPMAKRQAFRQQMQEQMEKVHQAKTPEERQKLMEDFEQTMQKHRDDMWGRPGDEDSFPPRRGDYDQRDGDDDYYGYRGSDYGYPNWDDNRPPSPMPPYGYGPPRGYYNNGDYGRPFSGRCPTIPARGFMGQRLAPQTEVEQHLVRIEKLLEEILKSLPKSPETKSSETK